MEGWAFVRFSAKLGVGNNVRQSARLGGFGINAEQAVSHKSETAGQAAKSCGTRLAFFLLYIYAKQAVSHKSQTAGQTLPNLPFWSCQHVIAIRER